MPQSLSDILADAWGDDGGYKVVALACAAILTGEAKDKSKAKLGDAAQDTLGVAESYLEWLDPLSATLPELPAKLSGKK